MRRLLVALSLLSVIVLPFALGVTGEEAKSAPSTVTYKALPPLVSADREREELHSDGGFPLIVAVVNGDEITGQQLAQSIARKQDQAMNDPHSSVTLADAEPHVVLDHLIDSQLLLQEARRRNLQPTLQEAADLYDQNVAFTESLPVDDPARAAAEEYLLNQGPAEDRIQAVQDSQAINNLALELASQNDSADSRQQRLTTLAAELRSNAVVTLHLDQ